jgi:hypothetical protein
MPHAVTGMSRQFTTTITITGTPESSGPGDEGLAGRRHHPFRVTTLMASTITGSAQVFGVHAAPAVLAVPVRQRLLVVADSGGERAQTGLAVVSFRGRQPGLQAAAAGEPSGDDLRAARWSQWST